MEKLKSDKFAKFASSAIKNPNLIKGGDWATVITYDTNDAGCPDSGANISTDTVPPVDSGVRY